jgi:HPt (histidine-containing phosphotransfer) domain-containing protein
MFKTAGMDALLVKPIDTVKLRAILEKWLPKEKLHKITSEDLENQRENSDESQTNDEVPVIKGVNTERGLMLSGGELSFYKKVLSSFADNAREYGKMIRECLESGDVKLFTTSVHALKSAGANIGADRISSMAESLEASGKANDAAVINDTTPGFLAELEELANEIDSYIGTPAGADAVTAENEDLQFLKKQLTTLAEAADNWDVDSVQIALNSLNNKSWGTETAALLKKISEGVLCGDFDETSTLAKTATNNL